MFQLSQQLHNTQLRQNRFVTVYDWLQGDLSNYLRSNSPSNYTVRSSDRIDL